jgi:hypothetical protein
MGLSSALAFSSLAITVGQSNSIKRYVLADASLNQCYNCSGFPAPGIAAGTSTFFLNFVADLISFRVSIHYSWHQLAVFRSVHLDCFLSICQLFSAVCDETSWTCQHVG